VQFSRSALASSLATALRAASTGRASRSTPPKACWLRFWSLSPPTNLLSPATASSHPRHSCQRVRGTHLLVALLRPVRASPSQPPAPSRASTDLARPRDLVVRQPGPRYIRRPYSDSRSLSRPHRLRLPSSPLGLISFHSINHGSQLPQLSSVHRRSGQDGKLS
jgi:hypothetical protein